jgi:hypothetical protein
MPLPKQQINWLARVVVLLICVAVIALMLPVVWLLRMLSAPTWLVAPAIALHVAFALLSLLWTISVWFPDRGRKMFERFLKTPWFFS